MKKVDHLNSGIRGGLWDAKHYERMGDAIWLFGWLVHRQTTQKLGEGLVLRGMPLTYAAIAADTGFSEHTLRKWMRQLRQERYVSVKHSVYSRMVIRVLNAKKFEAKQLAFPQSFPHACRPDLDDMPSRFGRLKEGVKIEHKHQEKPRAAETAARSSPLSVPQVKYGEIGQLIGGALSIVSRARGMEGRSSAGDVREELKSWAAEKGLPYDSSRITTAIDIAEKRVAEGARR